MTAADLSDVDRKRSTTASFIGICMVSAFIDANNLRQLAQRREVGIVLGRNSSQS